MLLLVCMCLAVIQLYAQNRTVTGKVTDENGAALVGATVSATSSIQTVTNESGNFTISVPPNVRNLTISYVGYGQQVVVIGSGQLSIRLQPVAATDTIVVTGFKPVEKSKFAGANTKISEKEIQNRPIGSFDQLFQGRVPGVLGLTGSGQPGNPATVIIRGQTSILGSSDPLYVVDGIPVEAAVFQSINPNDFASMEVLRDASATALYGSRGSGGVIVITTKRGQSGKMKLGYSGQMGMKSRPQITYDMMSTSELLQAQEDYGQTLNNSGQNFAGTAANTPGWYYSQNNPRYATLSPADQARANTILDSLSGINTDWRDQFFRKGTFSNHQLTLSGGTGKTRIYSSLAFYNEEGTTLRTDMSRVTWRNNVDYADEKLTFRFSSNLGYTKRNFQQSTTTNSTGNPFLAANITVPYAEVRNPDGTYATGTGAKFVGANALDLVDLDKNYNDQLKGILGMDVSYKIASHVTAGLTAGIDFRETQSSNYGSKLAFLRRTSTSITGREGFMQEALTRFIRGNVRPTVGYKNTFNNRHELSVDLYGEYVKEYVKSFSALGYVTDSKRPNTIAGVVAGNAVNQLFQTVGGGRSENALVSGLSVARYTLDRKYTIGASYRRDGSSKLPSKNRWQSFYSVDGIWDIKRENFLSGSGVVNELRLRASYGSAGNADNFPFGDFGYIASYGGGTYSGLNTLVATNPGNSDLKWETTYTLNVGVDFGLWRRKIYGSVDVYDKRTKDLFIQKTLSAQSGFGNSGLPINGGELGNKGIEVVLNYDIINNANTQFTVFGNFGYNKNEVLSLGGESEFEQGTELIKVGMPLGSHYEVRWGGVDAATGAPLYYDLNGVLTNAYSASNAVQQFGTWESPWKGGFGTRLNYKGFDASALFSFQAGGKKMNNLEYFMENPVGFLENGYNQATTLNFWKNPGDIATTPSPLYSVNFSSKLIHDASFVRLRDVTLGYTLQNKVLNKMKFISSARFYVQGSNLFMLTNWRGMDPEAGATNINLSEFPNPRAFTAGLDIQF